MKTIQYIFYISFLGLILSCNDDDFTPVFNESSGERIAALEKEYKDILLNAENGWIVSYTPNNSYGVYNMWMDFTEEKVNVVSDVPFVNDSYPLYPGAYSPTPGYYKETTTNYRVSSQQVIDLVFENHMVLHYLYTLDNNNSEGEFDFYFKSVTEDQIVLESKLDEGEEKTELVLLNASNPLPDNLIGDKEGILDSYSQYEAFFNDFGGKSLMIPAYTEEGKQFNIKVDLEKRSTEGVNYAFTQYTNVYGRIAWVDADDNFKITLLEPIEVETANGTESISTLYLVNP